MTLIITMAIRVILLFLPIILFIIFALKKNLKFYSVILVLILLINSVLMMFLNLNHKNIINFNSLDISTVRNYFSSSEFDENINEDIYITDKDNEFRYIAIFRDIVYRRYDIDIDLETTVKKLMAESTVLKETPEFERVDNETYCYSSNLKGKISFWNLLYNYNGYNGCIIVTDSNSVYYVEFIVELDDSNSDFSSMVSQMLYKKNFNRKIDVMTLFRTQGT